MSDAQIFQALSIIYLAVGIGIVINPQFYKSLYEDFVERTSVMYIGGMIAIMVGYLLVTFHNTWTKDFSVIITILGWISLVKGILIFVLPNSMIAITKKMIANDCTLKMVAMLTILLGVAFSFLGFCPKSPILPI